MSDILMRKLFMTLSQAENRLKVETVLKNVRFVYLWRARGGAVG
jgi:hypothetical protein